MPASQGSQTSDVVGPEAGEPGPSSAASTVEGAEHRLAEDVLAELGVDVDEGLSAEEVRRRRDRYGPNTLQRTETRSAWAILIGQLKSILIVLLIAAGVAAFALGEILEGFAVLAAVVVNTAIGFFTELRARTSVEALQELGRSQTKTRRGGTVENVSDADLVPGDVVELEEGDVVPADLRVVEASHLRADEAALTGESVPVDKGAEPVEQDTSLAERSSMLFKGTAVSSGSGVGVVVGTGMGTQIGEVSQLAKEAGQGRTPLEQRLDALGRALVVGVIVVAGVVGGAGIAVGQPVRQMIETAIALAVAAVPEGLPIVATLALARGVQRMARRNAVVKRLSSVETLGSATVIFSDETGTLTEGRMRVRCYLLDAGDDDPQPVEVSDEDSGRNLGEEPVLRAALLVGLLCGNPRPAKDGDTDPGSELSGDPMEVALTQVALSTGWSRQDVLADHPRLREEAFSRETRMMATYHGTGERGAVLVAVKGAPEAVLQASSRVADSDEPAALSDDGRRRWLERSEDLAAEGLRVLGLAHKLVDDSDAPAYEDLIFLGFVGLLDPPRGPVREAVGDCRRAGIRVVMVTGDHPATAQAIAAQVGIIDGKHRDTVQGADVAPSEEWTDEERQRLLHTAVFARLDPAQKLDLIDLYQEEGWIVGMTGDGVNDAPALESADIGIALGSRGTQVARDSADIVLQDDAFDTIVAAVAQGRTIFGNIRRFVIYLLSGNLGEILAVAAAAVANVPLPLLPLQILYINFISDVFPAVGLGLSRGDERVLDLPPRDPGEPILSRRLWAVVAAWATLIGVVTLCTFAAAFALGWSEQRAVTVSFMTFVLARLLHVFNMRDPDPRVAGVLDNRIVKTPTTWLMLGISAAVLLAGLYVPIVRDVLGLVRAGLQEWGLAAAGAAAVLVVGQVAKVVGARMGRGNA